jgi:molybdopterin converting factor subunit 1
MITVLYFAWVRERVGTSYETLNPPDGIRTVGALLDWLSARSAGHAEALAERDKLRFAVNQTYVDQGFPVKAGDEVALFPPVTGG